MKNTVKVSLIIMAFMAVGLNNTVLFNIVIPKRTDWAFNNAIKAKDDKALDEAVDTMVSDRGLGVGFRFQRNYINKPVDFFGYRDTGNTWLHIAVLEGYPYGIKKLLALGADPRIKNNEGKTPVDLATEKGPMHLLPIFLEAAHAKK